MLLATKCFTPTLRTAFVARPRLLAKLDASLTCRLILVAAPAGFGKSTVVSHWLQSQRAARVEQKDQRRETGFRHGWLSLDEGDNDPARFFAYLAMALQKVAPQFATSLPSLLQTTPLPPLETMMTLLVNDLAGLTLAQGEVAVLVLDDYHLIENGALHEAVTFLLEHCPPHFHLMLNSRSDPPLPLARWRVRRELAEIRADDLRFTQEEAAHFFNETMALSLSTAQIRELGRRTEGWAAALQLATVSIHGRTDIDDFIASFSGSHHFVLDYLTDEVLENQPPERRAFMLRTAILKRFSAPLCAALLTDVTDDGKKMPAVATVQRLLEELEQANLFVIRLDDERRWYRYHHLFAEFLRKRLHDEVSVSAIQQLYRQAALWCDREQLDEEAIDYALQSSDSALTTHLVEKYLQIAMGRSELHKILRWFDALQQNGFALTARFRLWYCWAMLFSGQTDKLPPLLDDLASIAAETSIEAQTIAGNIAALQGWLTLFAGRHKESMALAQQALEELPSEERYIRSISYLNLGYAYQLEGNLSEAIQGYRAALTHGEVSGNLITAVFARTYLANAYRQQGDLFGAEQAYRQAIAQATEDHQLYSPATGVAYIGLSELLREWYRLDEAAALIEHAITLLEQSRNEAVLAQALPAQARTQLAQGKITEALATLQRCDEIARSIGQVQQPENNDVLRTWIHLRYGDAKEAYRWAAAQPLPELTEMAVDSYRIGLALGAIWGRESASKAKEALALLAPLREATEANGYAGATLHATILQAVACQTLGDDDGALAYLEQALTQAEPEGYIAQFVSVGPPMQKLLQVLAARGRHRAYIHKLLGYFVATQESVASSNQATLDEQPLIEPLSERELEVLELLAEGCSNAEIAKRLIITVGTVKRHVSNIYGKLGVGSRTQAVAYAREIGLL